MLSGCCRKADIIRVFLSVSLSCRYYIDLILRHIYYCLASICLDIGLNMPRIVTHETNKTVCFLYRLDALMQHGTILAARDDVITAVITSQVSSVSRTNACFRVRQFRTSIYVWALHRRP